MTISDDRLTSIQFLAFAEKLLGHHYWTADDYDIIPDDLVVEIFPFVLDMKQINS